MTPRDATLALLRSRAEGASICPSEVARALAGPGGAWRDVMPDVHAEVDRMVGEGLVRLSWKGRALPLRDGPYRIRRAEGQGEGRST